MSYGIKHKETGLWFAGFNADNSVRWSEKPLAMSYDAAVGQALLLKRFDVPVQQKPVTIG